MLQPQRKIGGSRARIRTVMARVVDPDCVDCNLVVGPGRYTIISSVAAQGRKES